MSRADEGSRREARWRRTPGRGEALGNACVKTWRTCFADLILAQDEDRRDDHDSRNDEVDVVTLACPVCPHGRAEQRHDCHGHRALRIVVDVGDVPRLCPGGDLVLHPQRHERVRANALELAADDPDHAAAERQPTLPKLRKRVGHGERATHQMSDMTHHLHRPSTRRKTVRSSLVSGRGGMRAMASSRSALEKTIERLRSGVSGKQHQP